VPTLDPDHVALEVIREYSANELLGKIYTRSLANWWPLDPSSANNMPWFTFYTSAAPAARTKIPIFSFEMDGSGLWRVLHFRNETDETGPYVAVALQYPN